MAYMDKDGNIRVDEKILAHNAPLQRSITKLQQILSELESYSHSGLPEELFCVMHPTSIEEFKHRLYHLEECCEELKACIRICEDNIEYD